MAVPPFCLGILLVSLFAVELGWLPTRGYVSLFAEPLENLRFLALPAITLGFSGAAYYTRLTRTAMIDELAKDYDEIFVDTPPAYNFFTQSALIAADRCLIPFD